MPCQPALLTSAGRMPERSQHRVSEGQHARSERPAVRAWAAPAPPAGVADQRRQDAGAQSASSERRAACPKRTSGCQGMGSPGPAPSAS